MAVAGRDGDLPATSRSRNSGSCSDLGLCGPAAMMDPRGGGGGLMWPVGVTVKRHVLFLGSLVLECCLQSFLNNVLCK